MKNPISITALSSFSSLGSTEEEVWKSYQRNNHLFDEGEVGQQSVWMSRLSAEQLNAIEDLRKSDAKYRSLDKSVLFAMHSGRKVVEQAGWDSTTEFGINIGSSRGATSLFEKYHEEFLTQGKASTLASPTTTLGNISSWVAHDLKSKGPNISHSITCSTALHAVLNGVAWITSGLTDKFLVGGSESPLTPFTIAQMQALKIYSKETDGPPCRALDLKKTRNSMVLGEGAALACLEKGSRPNALARIVGMGYATEPLTHNVSISTDAQCFQDSMRMALNGTSPKEVDAIILHAPGTVKGDLSEYRAIENVFDDSIPFLTTNKWKVGHTFGASGMLSIEMALLMLKHNKGIASPFYTNPSRSDQFNRIIVNAVGFGGNAVSILIEKAG
ncbi:beta-ketoacyl synthase [Flagellimonas allohymeniacidonis]|uniref:Beta-ketoacyl synthase n=1 Tax=Flagellimonas allohymeniacidonis TaxID=2517819 RepID=A0A4Q8QHT8_9FLAO|nr:beta-ketoacyl synthase N-terminal-like domain-containing protein [Allomuricauda hymeniacidonis]TAI48223.1 beta-ketoacyl synthase [Allomuricauda hymeniacidonis]